ncbi:MAG TPA: hypothetical protein DD412_03435 [Holosporales bacterium]|nr:hypothetical protein [Holosporales bacterium]
MTIFRINELLVKYHAVVSVFDTIVSIIISVGLFYVAFRANGIAKSNLQIAKQEKEKQIYKIHADERKIFHSVYNKLSNAITLVLESARVTEESKALFWQARDQARLEMPDDIKIYTQNLFDKMYAAYLLELELESIKETKDRQKPVKERMKLISSLIDERPHEIFSKHLKIPGRGPIP